MKIITTFQKREFVVSDKEAEFVAKSTQKDGMIELSSGEYLNPRTIDSISNIPEIAYYKGYAVNKDGRTYTRDGQKITIEYLENVEYLPDPKYARYEEDDATMIEGSKNLIQ